MRSVILAVDVLVARFANAAWRSALQGSAGTFAVKLPVVRILHVPDRERYHNVFGWVFFLDLVGSSARTPHGSALYGADEQTKSNLPPLI